MAGRTFGSAARTGRPRKPRAEPKGAEWEDARRWTFQTYGHICYLCGCDGAYDIDHWIPVPKGDVAAYLDRSNLHPAHGTRPPCPIHGACNQSKQNKLPGQQKRPCRATTGQDNEPTCCRSCHDFWQRTRGRNRGMCWTNSTWQTHVPPSRNGVPLK